MRKPLVVLLLVAVILFSGCSLVQKQKTCEQAISELPKITEENQGRFVEVKRVIDGDTLELENGQKVRFIGINTPEKGRKYSKEAQKLTEELVANGVSLSRDEEPEDRYGRLLRYAFSKDTFVNARLIAEGLATTFQVEPNTKYSFLFSCLEKEAKQNRKGIWSSPSIGNYSINLEVNYNAEGNDNQNLNGEFVEITNLGTKTVSLEDWSIKDKATHEYTFRKVLLGPNESLTLYTGSGADSATELYWNSTKAIWNNNGDTAYLFDADGNLVTLTSFP